MLFVLSKLFWLVAAPANLLLILLVAGVWLARSRRRRRRRLGRGLVGCVAVALAVIAVFPVGKWALVPLENRFPTVTEPPARVDGVVVLGGAVDPILSLERGQPQLNEAAERLTALVSLAGRYPEATVVFTGGSGRVLYPDLKESATVRGLLLDLGLPPGRVLYEDESRNTHENAVFTRRLARPGAGETWLLVTSAVHMPRAVGTFRAAEWTVVPYPVDYRTRGDYLRPLDFDLLGGLMDLSFAEKEWIGLVAYRLFGRTESLFPAPSE